MSNVIERPQVIALCIPGEYFHNLWVTHVLSLFHHLVCKFIVAPITCYSSAVHVTRHEIAQAVLESNPPADFALWLDDDNMLTAQQFEMLFTALTEDPEAVMVAGWTVISADGHASKLSVSCGTMGQNGRTESFPLFSMQGATRPRPIEWTGFPVVLMRTEALRMAGKTPFAPIPNPAERSGVTGEDCSFCQRIREAGGKMLVHPEVAVPHLKLRNVLPGSRALEAQEVVA